MGESVLLNNGTVLIAGGQDNDGNSLASVEVYDPATGTFSVTGDMNSTRQSLTATLLESGQVLIAGGMEYYAHVLTSAELYQPTTLTPTGLTSIMLSPESASLTVGSSQQFTATGTFSDNSSAILESATWSTSDPTVATVSNDASNYGNVFAVAAGTVTVTACTGSICDSVTLTVTPAITSLYPTSGEVSTSVTITGMGFGTTQGTSAVTFNTVLATPITWTATNITVPVPAGATTGNVVVTVNGVPSNGIRFTVVGAPGFATGTNLNTPRWGATATLLDNGSVLVVGGADANYNVLARSELYNPATGAFTTAGSLGTGRTGHTATLLGNGTVLITGGYDSNGNTLARAEIYNPSTSTFYGAGNLTTPRVNHTATTLKNGRVLLVGGMDNSGNVLAAAEIYDPAQGTFTATGSLNAGRQWHTATLLDSGAVLIAGGSDVNGNILAGAELYDPTTGAFTVTGSLNVARDPHTATLLNNGMVLVVGGFDSSYNALASAELYNPAAGTFALTGSLHGARRSHAATLLNSGVVLIAGGYDSDGNALDSAELFDPTTGSFAVTGSLNSARGSLTAILLNNGTVLIVGGLDSSGDTITGAELYLPMTFTPPGLASIAVSPLSPVISLGATQAFTATGTFTDNSTETLVSVTWSASNNSIATISNDSSDAGTALGVALGTTTVSACAGSLCGSATLTVGTAAVEPPSIASLSPNTGPVGASVSIVGTNFGVVPGTSTVMFNGVAASPTMWSDTNITVAVPLGATTGNVVVTVNGVASNGVSFTVLPPTGFSTAASISQARWAATATLLVDGTALIAGGVDSNSNVLSNAELYNPTAATFTTVGSLSTGRRSHTATLLNNGTVLIVGGQDSNYGALASSEIYNPATGTFASSSSLTTARFDHTATLLNNGTVLIIGGTDQEGNTLASTEIYDPATGTFTVMGSLKTARDSHTATLLNDGKVLVAGGWDNSGNPLASAELYDSATGTFETTGSLNTPRSSHTATLMNDGSVLMTGGWDSAPLATAEVYSPAAGTFAVTGSLNTGRTSHTATLLNNGTVLIAGGWDQGYNTLASAELYDLTSAVFSVTSSLTTRRSSHTATLLINGAVLLAGGLDDSGNALTSAELYQPNTLSPAALVSIAVSPANPSIAAGTAQRLAATGTFSDSSTQTLASAVWSSSSASVAAVTNDVSNHGNGYGLTQGTATVSACTGPVCGAVSLTVGSAVTPTPSITGLSPSSGPVGTTVAITGTALGASQGNSTVTFNGVAATVSTWGSVRVVAQVPQGAATGDVVVTVGGTATNSLPFTVLTPPSITSLSPTSGSVGTLVTITGTGFGSAQGTGTVTFNGAAAAPITWSDTAITVLVPLNASTGNVVVSENGLASNGMEFMVLASTGSATPGSLTTGRWMATGTLLNNGTVLIAGGMDNDYNVLASAEIYDPTTGTFVVTGSLNTGRQWHTATLLNDGKVLLVGGQDANYSLAASAEIYDPATATFSIGGSLNTPRIYHTATLLTNGTVLISGGDDSNYNALSSAEIYDPSTGAFTVTSDLNVARFWHTATLLNSGMVLLAGGIDSNGNALASAELYNPATATFASTGNLNSARFSHTATLLNGGMVLVAGGEDSNFVALASSELYNPTTGTFSSGSSLTTARVDHTATLLNNGMVLISGGWDADNEALDSNELYDPAAASFASAGTLSTPRGGGLATLLDGGAVLLVTGVDDSSDALASADLYQPSTLTPAGLVTITVTPVNPSIAAGSVQQFAATGTFSDNSTESLASATWSSSDTSIAVLTNDASNRGLARGLAQGSATVSACTGSLCGTTLLSVGGAAGSGPTLTGLSPTSGPVNTVVTITGTNLGTTPGSSAVTFNGTQASVVTWSPVRVVVQVPEGATTGNVVITVNGVASNGITFTVAAIPSITGLSPTSGQVGATVTITGTNFRATQGSSVVTFNSAAATPTLWSDTLITAVVPSNATTGSVVVTALGQASNAVPFKVVGAPGFATTGSMNAARWGATATMLSTGAVLLAGGFDSNYNLLATAEVYDSLAGSFAFTGDLNTARIWQTAALLNNGQVLIVGGRDQNYDPLASAELYDPITGAFTPTGNMSASRYGHTATVLRNGQVLIVGGMDSSYSAHSTAELYDPATGTFLLSGDLLTPRYSHTATLLNSGMVLITGGYDSYGNVLSSAELYDPSAGTFGATGSLNTARVSPTATLLNSGKVLVAGGVDLNGRPLGSTEVYDPGAGTFTAVGNLRTSRQGHTATLLNNGKVLVAGGWDASGYASTGTEVYDPSTGTFAATGSLNAGRAQSTATLLANGGVLVAGGMGNSNSPIASSELYQPVNLTPAGLVSIAISPLNPSVTENASQRLTATGTFSDNSTQTLASATWSSSSSTIATVTSDASNFGSAYGAAVGSATVSACTGSVCGSATLAVGSQTSALPIVMGLAPGSGAVGSWVAVSGENFGAAQGSSTVTFGGTTASVVSWSDTAVLVTVPGTLTAGQTVSVVLTTTAGASNTVDFTVVSTTAPYRVSPQNLNLLVGQTRTVSVTDSSGNALTGLDWSTSDAGVVSLSTDDPPVITAVAPGTAIIYVVGLPILVTVYSGTSLPSGTAIWSVPISAAGGSGWPVSMVPAVPSSSGVDLFVLDTSGALNALSSDGSVIWKSQAIDVANGLSLPGGGSYGPAQVIPDFSGNALVKAPTMGTNAQNLTYYTHNIDRVDASTGAANVIYTFGTSCYTACYDLNRTEVIIPHPSGVLFVQDDSTVSLLQPSTGQQLANVSLENSTNWTTAWPANVGQMIVAGDGNAYLPYTFTEASMTGSTSTEWTIQTVNHLRLLRFSADGTSNKISLGDWTAEQNCTAGWAPPGVDPNSLTYGYHCSNTGTGPGVGSAITNVGTGVAVFATVGGACADTYYADYWVSGSSVVYTGQSGCPDSHLHLTYVSSDAVTAQFDSGLTWNTYNGSVTGSDFVPSLQREDGSYIGADCCGNVFAIGTTGSVVWQQQLGTAQNGASNPPALTPLYATADGGVIATSMCQAQSAVILDGPMCGSTSSGTLYTLDKDGNVTSQTTDPGAVYSWTNQWYDPPPAGGTVSAVTLAALNWGYGAAAFAFGNPSKNLTATDRCPALDSTSKGLIETASSGLYNFLLHNTCPFCIANMFPPLHTSQAEFTAYLGQGHRFCDGTKSKEPATSIDPEDKRDTTVADYFRSHAETEATAVSGKSVPLWVYFRPNRISTRDPYYNESTVFHEGLHGETGVGDGGLFQTGLCQLFTLFDNNNLPLSGLEKEYPNCVIETKDITLWIEKHVFGRQPSQ